VGQALFHDELIPDRPAYKGFPLRVLQLLNLDLLFNVNKSGKHVDL